MEGLADFDGDGKADILWRNTDGAISTWLATGTGFTENSNYDAGYGPSWQVAGLEDIS